MTTILVYQDFIHNVFPIYRALCETFGAQATRFCTAQDLQDGHLTRNVDLFVMPGGADLYYVEKLEGRPNEALRNYVRSGGRYLGVCGGAYYAAARILYAHGTPHQIAGPRALGFFSGQAVGPVSAHARLDPEGFPDPDLMSLLIPSEAETVQAVYWGGPAFLPAPHAPEDGQVLARYVLPDAPPAIVRTRVGQGRAVLCGVHPEITPEDLDGMAYAHDGTREPLTRMAATLRATAPDPRALWARVVDWTMG